ncbi:MAG: caspase family protein, partial [Pseudomonadota bacterium]
MRRRDVLALGASALAWPGAAQPGSGPPRLALVIGNAAYSEGVGPLRNTINDAGLISERLKDCGFVLHGGSVATDLTRRGLLNAVRGYETDLAAIGPDGIGYFYFAGHGAAHPERGNYLIPVGDYQELDDTLWDDSITLDWLFNRLGSVSCPHIVNIDACRNVLRLPSPGRNLAGGQPFRSLRSAQGGRQRPNMFISYATWEGQLASDGDQNAEHGPYATALAGNLLSEGKTVRDLFEDVRLDVLELTGQIQEPMNISRLSRASKDLALMPDVELFSGYIGTDSRHPSSQTRYSDDVVVERRALNHA